MAKYLGVRAVEAKGQKIQGHLSEKQPIVPNGKRLIAILQNGVWKIAPDVTHPAEYAELYKSYSQGNFLGGELYLLDENLLAQCPDEGRVNLN